jgi:hypothetical protein
MEEQGTKGRLVHCLMKIMNLSMRLRGGKCAKSLFHENWSFRNEFLHEEGVGVGGLRLRKELVRRIAYEPRSSPSLPISISISIGLGGS